MSVIPNSNSKPSLLALARSQGTSGPSMEMLIGVMINSAQSKCKHKNIHSYDDGITGTQYGCDDCGANLELKKGPDFSGP